MKWGENHLPDSHREMGAQGEATLLFLISGLRQKEGVPKCTLSIGRGSRWACQGGKRAWELQAVQKRGSFRE